VKKLNKQESRPTVIKKYRKFSKLAHIKGVKSDKNKQSIIQKALNQMVNVQKCQIGIIE
jgi:hypothetical protein